MGLLSRLLSPFVRRPVRGAVRASYDAAQTTTENARHWAAADYLSPDALNSPETRRLLRARARYEVANNAYARGLVDTLANYTVGTGPRLNFPESREIQIAFNRWAGAAGLPESLRQMRVSRAVDGEAFALLTTNPAIRHAVQLAVVPIEADRIATPNRPHMPPETVDGIDFDGWGNPVRYWVLPRHPGDPWGTTLEPEPVPAAQMLHDIAVIRPGTHRGVPEILHALPLYAMLRRYTLATLRAAETAADLALILKTTSPPMAAETGAAWETIELERGMATVLPAGYDLGQAEPAQPVNTYKDFKAEILAEAARGSGVPRNIATGDSSAHNFSSGRLDHLSFANTLVVDRDRIGRQILDRILAAWLDEAALVEGLLPEAFRRRRDELPTHTWIWPGLQPIDPDAEAKAEAERLANLTTTLTERWAEQGRDLEDALDEIAAEREALLARGLEFPTPARRTEPAK